MTAVVRFSVACLRAVRDSMLLAWLLLGAFALSVVFSYRAGLTWRTAVPLLIALPVVLHVWGRAISRLENKQ